MRHRPRLFAATLTCAVALVGCGSQPSDQGSGGSAADDAVSDPTTAQSDGPAEDQPSGATTIPDDFPLSSGMGGPDDAIATSRTGTGLRDLSLCGTSPLRGLGTRDRMVADNSGGESLDTRELVVLGSPDEATELAQSISDLPADCDFTTHQDGFETTTEVRESPFGSPPAAVLVQTYAVDGEAVPGQIVVHVVPAGAALLASWMYGEWPDVDRGIDQTAEVLGDTVDALAMFDTGTSPDDETGPEPTESASPQAAAEIPDDFPLLAGWPADSTAEAGDGNGRHGPTRASDSFEFRACDKRWQEPEHVDQLHANWVNAEDYRSRQLTTYPDVVAAVAAVEGLVAGQRACPIEPPGEDGFGTTREVRPVELGGEAWAILERDTFDGSPSIFGESALVVRVGRAVLAVRHGGHAGYPSGDGQQQMDAMASQATEAIAEMCVFTRTGC